MRERFDSKIARALGKLLGASVMTLLESKSMHRILRLPHSDELRLDTAAKRGIQTAIRIDDTQVRKILDLVARYAGVSLDEARPSVIVTLPADEFGGAEFSGEIPPLSEGPGFVINTGAGLNEIRKRVLAARLQRGGKEALKAHKRAATVRRQENGKQGEARTEWVLLKKLWVMRRSVDVEGADFVVQVPPSDDPLWRWQPDLDVLGHVQAKFFEGKNSVQVACDYVEREGQPRLNFFLFLHTDDVSGREVRYFFTAAEIMEQWKVKGEYYSFSLWGGRTFYQYQDRSAGWIADAIVRSLKEAHAIHKREIHDQLRSQLADASRRNGDEYCYLFRRIENASVVLCRNTRTGQTAPLDARRDLFAGDSTFDWGRVGTAPLLLTVSLLAHHLGGREPSHAEREKLLKGLILHLKGDEASLSTGEIEASLSDL